MRDRVSIGTTTSDITQGGQRHSASKQRS
jgi:hypothetical protein